MAHTPGAWYTSGGDVIDEEGRVVASIVGSNIPKPERYHNLDLIAAAPDLLAALEQTLTAFEQFMAEANWKDSAFSANTLGQTNKATGTARAAIAKARGE